MYKRERLVLILTLVFVVFSLAVISAQNETTNDTVTNNADIINETDREVETDASIVTEVESEYPDAELEVEAGTTPDSFFYFLDSFFDRFGDDLKVREEKVAEVREMIREGKTEDALRALESYKILADKLEIEVDPDRRDDARRSAAAIRNAISELESEISEELRKEFVSDTLEREEGIITAAEISSKIKELCEQLSKLDPVEYSRVCTIDNDAPDWHKKLDKRLTEEQRQEAIKFGEIMGECFETAGQECRCEEIPFTDFAEMCSIAAPLATACEIEGNDNACEQLDSLEMPELPPHLQDVFDSLEKDVSESQFELHMPRKCREAGATSPKECMKIMIQTNAPEECRDALLEANVQNEREAREICEKIMFEQNAPEECVEQGLTNPRECGKLMFQLNAPQECLDAGLTGENRGDDKKCREIMESKRGEGERFRGPEGGFGGANCRGIQNPEERLKCYDSASQGAREHFEERREGPSGSWPEPCEKANAFTRESCEQVMRQLGEQQRQEFSESQPSEEFSESTTTPSRSESESGVTESSGETEKESTMRGSSTVDTTETAPEITGSAISNNGFFNYYFG